MNQDNHLVFEPYHPIEQFSLSDLQAVRVVLKGSSILDWRQLAFSTSEIRTFCRVHRIEPGDPDDLALIDRIQNEAVEYLRNTFDFPIPEPIRKASLFTLLRQASDSTNRHRQFCACTVLKAMHIINHFDSGEARQALVMTDQELFQTAERTVYRVISQMMADGLPVVEFEGGRKQRNSVMTKLLSKSNPLATQLFDKMRFRVVTATLDDILPVISYLVRNLFPFNYSIASESYNSLISFTEYCNANPHLTRLLSQLQEESETEERFQPTDNRYSSPQYSVVHWVTDMPIRIENFQNAYHTDGVNPIPRPLIYLRTEIQILDRAAYINNEKGHASHDKYKIRQIKSVADRLKLVSDKSPLKNLP